MSDGWMGSSGAVSTKVIRAERPYRLLNIKEIEYYAKPRADLPEIVSDWRSDNWAHNFGRGFEKVKKASEFNIPTFYGRLWAKYIPADSELESIDFGLVSLRVVTTAGVNFIVDAFQNTAELENLKYHGIGTGTNSEAVGDTALQTELTTQYNPDSTRATGSTTEGGQTYIYRTVGTNTVDSGVAITEHGIFSQAATGGGTLLDRSQFAAINLGNGDSLQTTYDLTFSAGG